MVRDGLSTSAAEGESHADARDAPRADPTAASIDPEPRPTPVPAESERRRIAGLVVRSDGTGIAEADVEVSTVEMDGPRAELSALAAVRTDEAGRFECPVPDRTLLLVRARAPGLAPSWKSPVFGGEKVTLILAAAGRLKVRVVDEDGAALAGARVVASCEDGQRASTWRRADPTDADGRAEIEGVPAGLVRVRASRTGLAEADARVRVDAGEEHSLELTLARGLRLFGKVTAVPDGEPLAGARVGHHSGAGVLTDLGGEYELWGIHSSKNAWAVLATKPGFEPVYQYVEIHEDRGDLRLDFQLAPAPALRGRVVDSNGRAVPGARVLLEGYQATHPFTAEHPRAELSTDSEGVFVLDPVHPSSQWTVLVRGPGNSCAQLVTGPLLAAVEAESGGRRTVDLGTIVLSEPASIVGRIEGMDGGLDESRVALSRLEAARGALGVVHGRRIPDPWGGFRFDDLAPGRYRVELHRDAGLGDEGILAVSELELEAGARCELVLSPGRAVLSGRLLDPSGRPLDRRSLHLTVLDSRDRVVARGAPRSGGAFELQLPGFGEYTLAVRDLTRRYEDELLPGIEAQTPNLVVRLQERAGGAAIEGWLLRSDGQPVDPTVYVAFRDAQTLEPLGQVAIPGERGAFRMGGLVEEPYLVELVDLQGLYMPLRARIVTPGQAPIEIVLEPRP